MKRKESIKAFDIVAIVTVFTVAVFIAYALLSIVVGGFPYLKAAIASKEVRFAIGLSVYTASISTLFCAILAIPCAYALTKIMPFRY